MGTGLRGLTQHEEKRKGLATIFFPVILRLLVHSMKTGFPQARLELSEYLQRTDCAEPGH